MPYNWNENAGQFRQAGGLRNSLRNPTSGWGRLANAVGQFALGPAGGLAANAIYNGVTRRNDARVTPMHGDTGWGFGMTPGQPGSQVTNQQLSDNIDQSSQQDMANRLMAARGEQSPQPGQSPVQGQPMQGNTQQQIGALPAAMRQWIAHNGLPQTPDQIRRATNAMYLDQSVDIANARYGEDIGFIGPFSRQPRER